MERLALSRDLRSDESGGASRAGRFLMMALLAAALSSASMAEVKKSASGLAYRSQGQGPALVLIHGSNLDQRMWDTEAALFAANARVIRYDLRGHGQSEIPEQPFLGSDDLLTLLDELETNKADLVGLSLGAQIAIDFALEHPERVDRMVLSGPGIGGYRPSEMPALFKPLMEALQEGDFEKANEALLSSTLLQVPAEKTELVASMVRSNLAIWSIPRNFVQQLDQPAIGRLGELKMPILVLVGDQDLPNIREQAELIASQARKARLEVVPGGGHLLNLTSPAAFAGLVSEFLGHPIR